jgi:hypothetical protein
LVDDFPLWSRYIDARVEGSYILMLAPGFFSEAPRYKAPE